MKKERGPGLFYKPEAATESDELATTRQQLLSAQADNKRLEALLHSREQHPDYEYATTTGGRKCFDGHAPEGEGWISNTHQGRDGWDRFDYHEEAYWMRLKAPGTTLDLSALARHEVGVLEEAANLFSDTDEETWQLPGDRIRRLAADRLATAPSAVGEG